MENNEPKKAVRRGGRKKFERILRSHLAEEVPVEIIVGINPKLGECIATLEEKRGKFNLAQAVNMALILKALGGDLKAYESIRDTLGEKADAEKEVAALNGIRIVIEDADNS